jgi:hypothetical protein
VPHVRTSVHGLKTTGRSPFQGSLPCGAEGALAKASILVHRVKALEKSIVGPGTLWRTWGTRPVPNGSVRRVTPAGLDLHLAANRRSTYCRMPPFSW